MTTLRSVGPITPVQDGGDGVLLKREDLAGWTGPDAPSGAKVRQYAAMIEAAPAGAVLMVGCAADSAMQVYLAHAAATYDRPATAVVPARKTPSETTRWAADHGVEILTVSPGYPSQYRAHMRTVAKERGLPVVRWNPALACVDTAGQLIGSADDLVGVQRVVIPSGSGLTAAGVLVGLATLGLHGVAVHAVAVSSMASADDIRARAAALVPSVDATAVPLTLTRAKGSYGRRAPGTHVLPDGVQLDAYYAAKAVDQLRPGDLLWVSGRRPF